MARRTTGTLKETSEVGTRPALSVWTGLYKQSWKSVLQAESFAHPAKFARGLIDKIYDHAEAEGWLTPHAVIVDPFGGIAGGAWPCVSRKKGYTWFGVELEQHFLDMGQGCDCTGIPKPDWVRFYSRWPKVRYTEEHYWCPRCLAQVAQVTGERRPTQRTFRTRPRPGRYDEWAMFAHGEKHPVGRVQARPAPKVPQKAFAHLPLPFPDRRDGYGPPPRAQALFAQETASYARSSGVIPHTAPHHYVGNIEAWAAKGYTGATLLQGDSRCLGNIIQAHADLLISSSPYAQSNQQYTETDGCRERLQAKGEPLNGCGLMRSQHSMTSGYGTAPGQLGALPPGSLAAALVASSPPYAEGCTHTGGADPQPQHVQGGPLRWVQYGVDGSISSPPFADSKVRGGTEIAQVPIGTRWQAGERVRDDRTEHGYSASPAQLGNMPPGSVAAVVPGDLCTSSPPYMHSGTKPTVLGNGKPTRANGDGAGRNKGDYHYPESEGQLATAIPDTFWSAAKQIISETYKILRPGAHAIWVTKSYIRDGNLVDFPGDWKRLAESCGFVTVHIHLAMLVERRVEMHLFDGAVTYEQWVESFFRRLGRKKTGIGIEFETVICQVKPVPPTPMPPDEAWQHLPLVDWSVASPPHGPDALGHARGAAADAKEWERKSIHSTRYGTSPAQLGAMPLCRLDACISSMPYTNSVNASSHGIDWSKAGPATGNRRRGEGSQHEATLRAQLAYGTNPDNLGTMPEGNKP